MVDYTNIKHLKLNSLLDSESMHNVGDCVCVCVPVCFLLQKKVGNESGE